MKTFEEPRRMFALYREPDENSHVAAESFDVMDILLTCWPSPGAEIIRNGRTFFRVVGGQWVFVGGGVV